MPYVFFGAPAWRLMPAGVVATLRQPPAQAYSDTVAPIQINSVAAEYVPEANKMY